MSKKTTKTAAAPKAPKAAAPKAAAPKKRAPRVSDETVNALIALLRKPKGTTYAEAAKALKIAPKGDKPHQTPAAQVRAMVRDRVRIAHEIIDGDFHSDRGGQVYHIK